MRISFTSNSPIGFRIEGIRITELLQLNVRIGGPGKKGNRLLFEVRNLKFLPTRESLAESNYGTMNGASQGTIYQGTLADNHKLATTNFKLISCQFFTPPVDGTIIEYQGLNP